MKATENKLLPNKWYYISLTLLLVIDSLFLVYRGWLQAAALAPYIILIYVLGRNYQKKKNPDQIL